MCGRFTSSRPAEVAEVFGLREPVELAPRYNIAPGQDVATVEALAGGARRLSLRRWGLIPPWAESPQVGYRMINARAETAAEKPAFREALRARRCLVPADGFFEWDATLRPRQPHWITRADGALLAMAALWEHWRAPDGARVESCTLLTTEAAPELRFLHDRMPLCLAPGDWSIWLAPEAPDPAALLARLRAEPPAALRTRPVHPRVNDAHVDAPSCLEPPPPAPIQGALFPA